MASMELELSGFTNPSLKWKMPSKGRQRTKRRPRTSFTGMIFQHISVSASKRPKLHEPLDREGQKSTRCNKKKDTTKSSKNSWAPTRKEPKRDISVSESEKLGAVLGKRFSDAEILVPAKNHKQITVKHTELSRDTIGEVPRRIMPARKASANKRLKPHEAFDREGKKRTQCNTKKPIIKSSKRSRAPTCKEPKWDISVSESEKLGEVLGKRLNDDGIFVPIKNRRIYLGPSSMPFHLDGSANQSHSDQGKYAADGNRYLKDIEQASNEVPDISGLLLLVTTALASVACDTDDINNVKVLESPYVDIEVERGIYEEKMSDAEKSPRTMELVGAKDDLINSSIDSKVIGNDNASGSDGLDNNISVEVALVDRAYCGSDSHLPQTGFDQAVEPGKVERLSNNDSEYEDGEIRGSVINGLGEEKVEEGKPDSDAPNALSDTQNVTPQAVLQDTLVTDISDSRRGKESARILGLRNCQSSQIERPTMSNDINRKDGYYVRASRLDETCERHFEFGAVSIDGSFRRCIPSRSTPNRGREDDWVDSRNHRIPVYHPNDAFISTAAYLERNGFVVAPDGTILGAGRGGSFGMEQGLESLRGRSPYRSNDVRRSRADRDGHGVVWTRGSENCHAHEPNSEPSYRRGQSCSLQSGPLHLSRNYTRSSLRSSTPFSTQTDHRRDRSSSMRPHSRTPYLKFESRKDRMRSQIPERARSVHGRPDFKSDQFKEPQYKKYSDSRQHTPSQDQKFDHIQLPYRGYHLVRSGRFPGSVAVSRELRGHILGNPRSHGDGREVKNLTSQCDVDGDVEAVQKDAKIECARAEMSNL